MDELFKLFSSYTFRTVALGCALLGICGGVSGTFAVLKKQSLLSDAISHCALPGIAAAFMLTGSKELPVLLLGALIAGVFFAYTVAKAAKAKGIDYGTALALIMSSAFGLGMVLLTVIQKRPNASSAGLSRFLFGQAAAVKASDTVMLFIVACSVISACALLFKELKAASFDQGFAKSAGINTGLINFVITAMIAVSVVSGLSVVGVILMSAMITAPAAAARQWTDSLLKMTVLSASIGAVCSVLGAAVSAAFTGVPTGPATVVFLSAAVLISLLLSPKRGLISRAVTLSRERAKAGGKS